MTKEERSLYNKEYYKKNKNIDLDRKKKVRNNWKKRNKNRIAIYNKEYSKAYRERRNELERAKRASDPMYRLITNSRRRVNYILRTKSLTKNKNTEKILGCSYSDYKKHLEKGFTEGMSWSNYGDWHVDHIIPLSIAKTESEIHSLLNYKNTQPLWAIDNLKKGAK